MGNRITRAAAHLSEEAVQKRMQGEQHPWRHQWWEIIYQALTTPRKAEDIARTVGVSPSTVHRVIAASNHAGVAAIDTAGKGGRRHQYLTLEQEDRKSTRLNSSHANISILSLHDALPI